ncbi:MAG: tetratricopeptide repeat protein [Planctomycetes bacterium]|nr:tetratricopeptide repeat protein [Planctomycetota bacterium]
MDRRPLKTLLVVLVLGWPLGCVSLPLTGPEAGTPPPPPNPPAGSQAELPPEKAAEVCLATAQLLEKNGQEAEAILQYEKARQCNPRWTYLSKRLAVLYDRQGDDAKAEAEYRSALGANPRDADLLNDIGYFHYQRGHYAEAEKYLRRAIALKPDFPRAWTNLGLVLGHERHYSESYDAFARCVSPAEARANVGILQAQQGDQEEARHSLQKALELDPNLQRARVVLAKLESPPPANLEVLPSLPLQKG